MRIVSCLVLLAGLGAAQDKARLRMVRVFGESLDAFAANFDRDLVVRDSPKSLAESYCRFVVDQNDSTLFLNKLLREEHLKIMRLYWATKVVEQQEKAYAESRPVTVQCKVVKVDGAEVTLLREWNDEKGKQTVKLVCEKVGPAWRIKTILQQNKEGKMVDRGLGVPDPVRATARVPRPKAPKRTSPEAAVKSFRDAIMRMAALGKRGGDRLTYIYTQLLGELCDPEAVAAEQREKEKEKVKILPRYEIRDTTKATGTIVRVLVVASEQVPVEPDKRSDVGTAAFDCTLHQGEWYLFAELARPDPEKPPVVVKKGFGLFFSR